MKNCNGMKRYDYGGLVPGAVGVQDFGDGSIGPFSVGFRENGNGTWSPTDSVLGQGDYIAPSSGGQSTILGQLPQAWNPNRGPQEKPKGKIDWGATGTAALLGSLAGFGGKSGIAMAGVLPVLQWLLSRNKNQASGGNKVSEMLDGMVGGMTDASKRKVWK